MRLQQIYYLTKFNCFNIFESNFKIYRRGIMVKTLTVALSILLITTGSLWSATSGGNGLLHVQSASNLKPGRLQFRPLTSFYGKSIERLGSSTPNNSVTYWSVTGDASLSYGIINHFDVAAMLRLYQDTNRQGEHNIPDDLFLDFKAGSIALGGENAEAGALLSFRIPVGDMHNYPLEPYAGGAFEFGIAGLLSYYLDPYFHDRDMSFHLNLGYYSHNDNGQVLFDEVKNPQGTVIKPALEASTSAAQLQYGAGFVFPTELFNINLELWGGAFISKPDTAVFSRENYTYFTPSVTFKPVEAVNFDIGIDIRVSKNENTTGIPAGYPRGVNGSTVIPNYSSWKFTLGMNFILKQENISYSGKGVDVRNRINFYESMLQEKGRTKSIEEELRRIRREREQAEKELEELRQLLEEDENK